VGQFCNFDTYKLDYGLRLTAAAGVTVTVNGANQRYVPPRPRWTAVAWCT
jgi:hypothetical protein